jgi:hypothetical protein
MDIQEYKVGEHEKVTQSLHFAIIPFNLYNVHRMDNK